MNLNDVSGAVVHAAFKVHSALGPGLLESAYQQCLAYELKRNGLQIRTEVPVPVVYDQVKLEAGYRLDLLVENSVIVEIKAVDALAPIHRAQLLSYLRLMDRQLGLLINFHVPLIRDGIVRVVNNFREAAASASSL
jgi:GxxExxY protein